MTEDKPAILHVLVVGFHHKKGCQVEFCYPPLGNDNRSVTGDVELPEEWKNLPTLALPDGAHNVEKDSIYFHLPSLSEPNKTVYGISCYRQILSKELIKRNADVTRSTVQKSVCVLSTLPLYGLIEAKVELITAAYFKERDFDRVEVLAEMHANLNLTLSSAAVETQAYIGLLIRELIQQHKHKVLVLFKLILLEKRVLFHLFPVTKLCRSLLTILSLFPGMIERGLSESALYVPKSHLISDSRQETITNTTDLRTKKKLSTVADSSPSHTPPPSETDKTAESNAPDKSVLSEIEAVLDSDFWNSTPNLDDLDSAEPICEVPSVEEPTTTNNLAPSKQSFGVGLGWMRDKINTRRLSFRGRAKTLSPRSTPPRDLRVPKRNYSANSLPRLSSPWEFNFRRASSYEHCASDFDRRQTVAQCHDLKTTVKPVVDSTLETDSWGFPLSIFTKGSLCHPYMSLVYIDYLTSANVRSYVVGATNALFVQRKSLFDVIVTENEDELAIEIVDPDLRKQLSLSTADLRFMEFLSKNVGGVAGGDVFLDGTGWEGGDEWIRLQFRAYLLSLLATAKANDVALENDFGAPFVRAWKGTHNYRIWASGHYSDAENAPAGHPFPGHLEMNDIKRKVMQTVNDLDPSRRKYLAVPNKAIESAIGGAKNLFTSVSNYWTSAATNSQFGGPEKSISHPL